MPQYVIERNKYYSRSFGLGVNKLGVEENESKPKILLQERRLLGAEVGPPVMSECDGCKSFLINSEIKILFFSLLRILITIFAPRSRDGLARARPTSRRELSNTSTRFPCVYLMRVHVHDHRYYYHEDYYTQWW